MGELFNRSFENLLEEKCRGITPVVISESISETISEECMRETTGGASKESPGDFLEESKILNSDSCRNENA